MDRSRPPEGEGGAPFRVLRTAIPILLLFLVSIRVGGIVSDYRAARTGGEQDAGVSEETTPTPDASGETTPTDEGGADGQDEGDSGETTEQQEEQAQAQATVVVRIEGLNFRDGPGTDTSVIDTLNEGERLALIDTENGWYRVRAEDGTVGWVSSGSQFVSVEQAE